MFPYTQGFLSLSVSPRSRGWTEGPFDIPLDKLTVLSKVEGLTVLSVAEGLTVLSRVEGITALSKAKGQS